MRLGQLLFPRIGAGEPDRKFVDELRSIGADPELVTSTLSEWKLESGEPTEEDLSVDQMLAGLQNVDRVWPSSARPAAAFSRNSSLA